MSFLPSSCYFHQHSSQSRGLILPPTRSSKTSYPSVSSSQLDRLSVGLGHQEHQREPDLFCIQAMFEALLTWFDQCSQDTEDACQWKWWLHDLRGCRNSGPLASLHTGSSPDLQPVCPASLPRPVEALAWLEAPAGHPCRPRTRSTLQHLAPADLGSCLS